MYHDVPSKLVKTKMLDITLIMPWLYISCVYVCNRLCVCTSISLSLSRSCLESHWRYCWYTYVDAVTMHMYAYLCIGLEFGGAALPLEVAANKATYRQPMNDNISIAASLKVIMHGPLPSPSYWGSCNILLTISYHNCHRPSFFTKPIASPSCTNGHEPFSSTIHYYSWFCALHHSPHPEPP